MFSTFLILALVGLVIGVFSGLLGVGGGTIMVPVFRLALGMSAVASTATSLFTIIPTSISGAIQHVRNKTCLVKLGAALGVGGACLSPLGVWLAQISPGWLVMTAVALVVCYSGITMLRKAMQAPSGRAPVAVPQEQNGGADSLPDTMQNMPPGLPSLDGATLVKAVLIGAVAGTASGYVGLGGGFLMIPLMVSVLRMSMKLASGTSLIAIIILATPATVMQCAIGNVNYLAGIALACGSIPGALIGARLTSRVPERALRFTFAAFLGVAAILLVAKEVGAM